MKIVEAYLTPNEFSRPGNRLREVRGIVMHYLGVPGQTAEQARNYFEGLKTQDSTDNRSDRSASAHYIIDHDGTILAVVPTSEKAYHCGSTIYTPLAQKVFGDYAKYPERTSPNSCTIGIELCHGPNGVFSNETIEAAIALIASLCKTFKLDPLSQILTHYEVVGWKACPELWVRRPNLFTAFKQDVKRLCS